MKFVFTGLLLLLLLLFPLGSAWSQLQASIDLYLGQEDVTIYAHKAFTTSDRAIVSGDFNGDGIADLVVASPFAYGASLSISQVGEAYIYFGSAIWPTRVDTAGEVGPTPDVIITGATVGDKMTEFGALAVGDFNGDGKDDLALGSRSADGPADARSMAGEAYIVFGAADMPANINLNSVGNYVTIYGASVFDQLTMNGAMTVGDFNGDGKDDLVLGTNYGEGPEDERYGGGEAYIIFGTDDFASIIDLAASEEDVTIYGATAEVLTFRAAMTVGDLNGDDMDDLILGTDVSEPSPVSGATGGRAYVIYGSVALPEVIDFEFDEQDVAVFAASTLDYLTNYGAMATGDFDNDGIDDLVLGAPNADGPSELRNAAGEVYIVFGSASLPAVIELNDQTQRVTTIYGAEAGHALPTHDALTIGDFNGDGHDDLYVGTATGDGPLGSRTNAGNGYIIFGSSTLPSTIDLALGDEDVTIYGADALDLLNYLGAISAGDINGDGRDDLILNAPGADGPFENRPGAGDAYVIYGSDAMPGTIDLRAGEEDITVYRATSGDFGSSLAKVLVDDFNGDGVDDFVLHSRDADGPNETRSSSGEAYIIFGFSGVIVDFAVPAGGTGTAENPFATVTEALAAVSDGTVILIRGDSSITDGPETGLISKPAILKSSGGSVRIGVQPTKR